MFVRTETGCSGMKGAKSIVLKMLMTGMATAIFSGMAFTNQIFGATVTQGTVKAKSVNVRQGSSTSAVVSFGAKENDTVAILSEEKGADGKVWYKVAIGESVGYIRSDLVTKTDNKINVSDSLVSVKTQASSTTVNNVATNTNTTNSPTISTNGTVSQTGNTGTQNISETLSNINVGIVSASSVRVRSMASVDSQIVTHVDKGTAVVIAGEGKAADGQIWYQIKTGNVTGFIRGDLLNKIDSSVIETITAAQNATNNNAASSNPATDANATQTNNAAQNNMMSFENVDEVNIVAGSGIVRGTNVRIRNGASITADILTLVHTGQTLPILGKYSGSGRYWIKTKININGELKDGYIAADYVNVEKAPVVNSGETEKTEEKKDEKTEEKSEDESNTDNKEDKKDNASTDKTASIKGTAVRIRQIPVIGNVICQLSSGHPLLVLGELDADDGHKWYQVSFSYQGSIKIGYVRDDFITLTTVIKEDAPIGDEAFEASIVAFPESYKNNLRALHAAHPQWTFRAVDTGLEWADALKAESAVGKNLVSKNSIASWKSTATQAYNWSNNTWYTFDGGSWVSASQELIAYYMDPRNFLNDSGIYQFETFGYENSQKKENVSKMLAGTFMSGEFTDTDGTTAEYADIFVKIGQMTGVSPYLLAGRCIQEQGINGKSQSVAGNVPGYEGYFNYFNVGAYAYSGRSATINGLIYAKGSDNDNMRPWNTRIKSIYGGAKHIADKYVSKGQDTLYFQKFNVVNSENTIYSHQYMSNIQAASSESARIQLAYMGDDEALTFKIPIYRNMPSSNCIKPTSDSSPNTYLSSLSVDGYELSPAFSGSTEYYTVNVDESVEYINISAAPVSKSASVGGTGIYQVVSGDNYFRVACKSQNGIVKTYTIHVRK